MLIVWDELKRLSNLDKHGLDFANLTDGFFAEAAILPAKANRLKAIGRLNDGTIAVVFALHGTEALSVISMRPASRTEKSFSR